MWARRSHLLLLVQTFLSLLSVKTLQFVTRMYRKSSPGAAFQVKLKQVNVASVGGAPPTMSGRGRPTFGSGLSGLGSWKFLNTVNPVFLCWRRTFWYFNELCCFCRCEFIRT